MNITLSGKVENILKGSLVWSHHLYLQWKFKLWAGKFAWAVQKFVDINQQCFASLTQVNFLAKNLNFHWRWLDWIQAIFLNLFNLPHCYNVNNNATELKRQRRTTSDWPSVRPRLIQSRMLINAYINTLNLSSLKFANHKYSELSLINNSVEKCTEIVRILMQPIMCICYHLSILSMQEACIRRL